MRTRAARRTRVSGGMGKASGTRNWALEDGLRPDGDVLLEAVDEVGHGGEGFGAVGGVDGDAEGASADGDAAAGVVAGEGDEVVAVDNFFGEKFELVAG